MMNEAQVLEHPTRRLSAQERAVLEATIRLDSQKAVAAEFGVSLATVKNQLAAARSKLDVPTTMHAAVKWATRNCDHADQR